MPLTENWFTKHIRRALKAEHLNQVEGFKKLQANEKANIAGK
jgi:hypothetical protein